MCYILLSITFLIALSPRFRYNTDKAEENESKATSLSGLIRTYHHQRAPTAFIREVGYITQIKLNCLLK